MHRQRVASFREPPALSLESRRPRQPAVSASPARRFGNWLPAVVAGKAVRCFEAPGGLNSGESHSPSIRLDE